MTDQTSNTPDSADKSDVDATIDGINAAPAVDSDSTAEVSAQKLNRRDMILIASGVAMLLVGKLADSAINGVAVADHEALQQAVAQLEQIPETIGYWESTSNTLTEREIEAAGIRGYIRREYRNPRTGYIVNLTILCGNSGPMSVHPPTACFQGVGYTLASGPLVTTITPPESSGSYEFNKSSFKQGDAAVPEIVRVFWAWSPDGKWAAPSNPRFSFRGRPYLYKMYVTDRALENRGTAALPQAEAFLKDALPTIANAISGS